MVSVGVVAEGKYLTRDGIKDPKTGKCTGISAAMQLTAIPAFVTDVTLAQATAQKAAK